MASVSSSNLSTPLIQDPSTIPINDGPHENKQAKANFISRIFFYWIHPLIKLGNQVFLEQHCLDELREEDKSSNQHSRFHRAFKKYKNTSNFPLVRSIITAFRGTIFKGSVYSLIYSSLEMTTPILIKLVIDFVSDRQHDVDYGIGLVVVVVLSRIFICLFDCHSSFTFNLLGYNVTNSISIAIYKKSLNFSILSSDEYKSGTLINMLQVDTQRLQQFCTQSANITLLPIQLLFGLYLMYDSIGISFLFGFGVIVIMGLVNYIIGRFSLRYQKRLMVKKDQRMMICSETFSSIKFIKANAFEEHFYDKIDHVREKEIGIISKRFICGVISICSVWMTPMLILCATFTAYVMMGNLITPQKAFTVISIFYILQEPIRSIPLVVNYFIECHVSIKRIEKFLLEPDINKTFLNHDTNNTLPKHYAIRMRNGNFFWKQNNDSLNSLSDDSSTISSSSNNSSDSDVSQHSSPRGTPTELSQKISELTKGSQELTSTKKLTHLSHKKNFESDIGSDIGHSHSEMAEEDSQSKPSLQKFGKNKRKQKSSLTSTKIYETQSEDDENKLASYDKYVLKNIHLTIPKGKMIAFVGDVGSGKSSLLYSLIGEMKFDDFQEAKPRVEINGEMAIVHQKPWIINGTVKDNILFGRPYVEEKYRECVRYACLETDFGILTYGDMTQIGDKGVNLSGGQKARISLARVLYSEADILLLDDILSAVDVHVGKSILQNCLMDYKKHTTRVVATHALHFLKYMDYIYILDKGSITNEGTYEKIQSCKQFKSIYKKYIKEQFESSAEDEDYKKNKQKQNNYTHTSHSLDQHEQEEEELEQNFFGEEEEVQQGDDEFKKSFQILTKQDSCDVPFQIPNYEEDIESGIHSKNKIKCRVCRQEKMKQAIKNMIKEKKKIEQYDNLVLQEDRKRGQVSTSVIKKYTKLNGGLWYIIGAISSMILWESIKMGSNVWISEWTGHNQESNNSFFLIGYVIFACSYGFMALIRSAVLLSGSIKCSRIIYRRMVSKLLFASLNEFFERIPVGRILNRLSKDVQVIDQDLAYGIGVFLATISTIIGDTLLCVYASSLWVLIPIFIFIYACKRLQQYYMNAQREIVRLETISRSPIVQYFGETLMGLPSIRAFRQQKRFSEAHCKNIDENKKNQIAFIAMEGWFKLNLTFLSLMVNTTAICFCLFYNKSDPSMTGLLLTFAFNIDSEVQDLIMSQSSVEKKIVSFERCYSYTKIESEKGQLDYLRQRNDLREQRFKLKDRSSDPLIKWPSKGVIEFQNVHLKYRPNLACVVKGLTFQIRSQEKIGVVGRTGAGKSTITLSILRIIEAFKGKIIIDGIDISQIRLDQLRSKITIILQDPQLFDGTIRQNVDPLGQYSDSEIIITLNQCQLHRFVNSERGLDTYLNEGGDNLSIGEKQLLCIARAMLKRSKIVLIDEATANIDVQTDYMIQQTIQNVFKDCTVLTIAHRINTIMKSDRIIVLNKGTIEEFDSPQNLLKNPKSLFYSIHQESTKETQF
ncbi:hypothetical protein ABPG72_020718 [Tetrahymena utriculariae]